MEKFTFLKPKQIFNLDSEIKRKISKLNNLIFLYLPIIPYTAEAITISVIDYLEKYYPGYGINIILEQIEKKGNNQCWILNQKEYLKKGEKIINDKKLIKKIEKDFNKHSFNFHNFVSILEKDGINSKDLKENYVKFLELYIKAFATVYCITGPITNGGYGDFIIKKLLRKYNYSDDIKNAISILTRTKCNFIAQEEKDLKKISFLIKKSGVSSLSQLKSRFPKIYNSLKVHQKKYYWIENNYIDVKYLSINYFFKKTTKQKDNKLKKNNYNLKNKISYKNIKKNDVYLLKKLGEFAEMHDQRKKINLIANYWLLEFLKRIAKKAKTEFDLLKFASFSEIIDLINGKRINKKNLLLRRKKCFIITVKGGKEYWLTGKDYNFVKSLISKKTKIRKKNTFKGLTANRGIVSGKARIVFDAKNKEKIFKKEEILVTSMTRPEFIPLAKKAKAIITDEGGITCHAAIISRELKIPCIIGTKIATKVLKDGDKVEVDAERGIVRIVKKAK